MNSIIGNISNPVTVNPEKTDYNKTIFIGRWLEILRPGFERISKVPEKDKDIAYLPVYKLAYLIKNQLLTSERLTKIYLRRLILFYIKECIYLYTKY